MRPKQDVRLSQVCVCCTNTEVYLPTMMLIDYSQLLEAVGIILMISMTS